MKKEFRFILTSIFLFVLTTLTFSASADSRFDYNPNYKVLKWQKMNRNVCKKHRIPKSGGRGKCDKYTKFEGVLESPFNTSSGTIRTKLMFYQSIKKGPRPLIVILPTLEGTTLVETSLATYAAKRGYHAVIAKLSENIGDLKRPITDIDGFLVRATVQARLTIDHIMSLGVVNPKEVGAFGASLGGIRLFTLMGVDSRIKSGSSYVGGVSIADILADSEQDLVKDYRNHKMKQLGLTDREAYRKALKEVMTVDPLDNIGMINPDTIQLKISKKDTSVHTKYQYMARDAIGTPHVEYTDKDHLGTVVSAYFSKKKIIKFLERAW
ncbi:MAG: hypothetical protein ACPGJV_05900 [Bacteriovoracaceae bacterium]